MEVVEAKRKTRSGVLALTATHLSFEQSGGSLKKAGRAAVFLSLASVSRISASDDGKLTVQHDGDKSTVFELEGLAARELRDAVTRVLALRHEARLTQAQVW